MQDNIHDRDYPPLYDEMIALRESYPAQAAFIESPSRLSAFIGGRGSGKTYGGAYRAYLAAYGYVGFDKSMKTPNVGLITAPRQDMLYDGAQELFYMLFRDDVQHAGKLKTVMRNGSVIIWRTASVPDTRRGPNLSWWWGDEAAQYATRVKRIIEPALRRDGRMGYQWHTSTPRGRNWIWDTFYKDNIKADLHQAWTRHNPFLDRDYADSLEESYGDTAFAAQELRGEIIAYQGLVYGDFQRAKHEYHHAHPAFRRVLVGVDWGFANPGVMLVVGFDFDDAAYVVEEHYVAKRTIDDWCEVGKGIQDRWHPERFLCDPSAPEYIKQLNAKPGVHAVGANNRVEPGIQHVTTRIAKDRLKVHSSCIATLSEFESYQRREGKDGEFIDEVVKSNDHTMDALRYAIMGADKPTGITGATTNYAR